MKKVFCIAFIILFNLFAASSAVIGKWENIGSPSITSFAEHGNYLWMGSSTGLIRYDKSTEKISVYNHANIGMPCVDIQSMITDDDGNVWMLVRDAQTQIFSDKIVLMRFNGHDFLTFTYSNSVFSNTGYLIGITKNSDGIIWVAANNALYKYDGTSWTQISFSYSSYGITSLTCDYSDNLWLGYDCTSCSIEESGLIKYDGFQFQKYPVSLTLVGNFMGPPRFSELSVDPTNGDIWSHDMSCLSPWGLYRFDGSQFYRYANAPLANCISSLAIDGTGKKWIKMCNNVVTLDAAYQWNIESYFAPYFIDYSNILSRNYYSPVSGTIYFASNQKFISINNNGYTVTPFLVDYPGNAYLRSMNSDNEGYVWFCEPSALKKVKNGIWQTFPVPSNFHIEVGTRDVDFDIFNNVWIVGNNRLLKFDGDSSWTYYPYSGIKHLRVDRIHNVIWFLTSGTLHKFDGQNWYHFQASTSLLPNFDCVWDMTTDNNGNVWLATTQYGLVKFDVNNQWSCSYYPYSASLYYGAYTAVRSYNDKLYTVFTVYHPVTWEIIEARFIVYDGQTFSMIPALSDYLSNISNSGPATCIYFYNNSLWIGAGAELIQYNFNTINSFTFQNSGLMSNGVLALAGDGNGNLFIRSHPNGISVYNERGIQETFNSLDNSSSLISHESEEPVLTEQHCINQTVFTSENLNYCYEMPEDGILSFNIIDALGRKVGSIYQGFLAKGVYSFSLNKVIRSKGIFFVRINENGNSIAKRILVTE